MAGRSTRRRTHEPHADAQPPELVSSRKTQAENCWLCRRPLGPRVEWHHPVPKSRGGRDTVPVHPICHATLHRHFTNAELDAFGTDVAALRAQPPVSAFLKWIAGKPTDFHAPTRRRRS